MEKEKANAFVSRLLQNPTMSGLNSLQKEEQILQFLQINGTALMPTLTSPQFFGSIPAEKVYSLLIDALTAIIDKDLIPQVEKLVKDVDLSFLNLLETRLVSHKSIKEELINYIKPSLKKLEFRRHFTGAYGALTSNFHHAYIDSIFYHRSYVFFELSKVERLKMGSEEMKNCIKLVLLLRSVITEGTSASRPIHEVSSGIYPPSHIHTVLPLGKSKLQTIPERVLVSALNSNLSFLDNPKLEATGRMASIISSRCKVFKPGQKTDKGAETSDKSWFSIARRNAGFYGFDIKILDELYRISSENGW